MSLRELDRGEHPRGATTPPAHGTGRRASRPWWVPYRRAAVLSDVVAVTTAMAVANIVRFDDSASSTTVVGVDWLTYPAISALIGVSWLIALAASRAYSHHRLGFGDEEYRALAHATFVLFGGLSMIAVLLLIDVARGFLAIALPLGVFLLFLGRWILRQVLVRRRAAGAMLEDSLLIGSQRAVTWTAEHIRRIPAAGYRVAAVVCAEPDAPDGLTLSDGTRLPNLRRWDRIMDLLDETGIRTVIVADDVPTDRRFLRQLSWQFEGTDVQLVLTSRLTDVAGPRIHWRPVEGLPLMAVDTPQFSGAKYALKRAFDLVIAATGLLVTLPLLLVTALAVKLQDGGPVLYRQERVGIDGTAFTMYKFRSMRPGADEELAHLAEANRACAPPLQGPRRSAGHAGGPHHPRLVRGRAAAAGQRAARGHGRGGPASPASPGGGAAAAARPAPAQGQARDHRSVAGGWALGALRGGDHTPGPVLRGELVTRGGRHHRAQDRQGGPHPARGVLRWELP
ncbi:sugar transferase [Kocuria rhizophila]|nr:sugar transferase [Kocuria rhizophila]MCT1915868.1 sugar transferase [Kocuria rhizophila]MDN3225773.1 sugar transferase [Kocuria rhizophila]